MSTPLSLDLRVRVLAAVAAGLSHREAGERFGVSAASVSRWRALEREQGDARPRPMGGDQRSHAIEAHGSLVVVDTDYGNAVASLQANRIDVMFVLDPTAERRKAVDFPDSPMLFYVLGALVGPRLTVERWSDLDRPELRIGVTLGTSPDRTVTRMMKSATIQRFPSNDEAVAAFAARRVDVVAQFHPALIMQQARLRLGVVVIPEPTSPIPSSAALRKDDGRWRDWLSVRFARYYEDGTTERVFREYLASRGVDAKSVAGVARQGTK